jgi:hypothetical protein
MKVQALIEQLQQFDGQTEVAIYDWRQGITEDDGDGSSAGVYPMFNMSHMHGGRIPKGAKSWIALEFANAFLNDSGQRELPWNDKHLMGLAAEVYSTTPVQVEEFETLKWEGYIRHLRQAWVLGFKAAFAQEVEEE